VLPAAIKTVWVKKWCELSNKIMSLSLQCDWVVEHPTYMWLNLIIYHRELKCACVMMNEGGYVDYVMTPSC